MAKSRKSQHRTKRGIKPTASRYVNYMPRERLLPRPRLAVLTPIEDFRRQSFPIPEARSYRLATAALVRPEMQRFRSLTKGIVPRLSQVLPMEAIVCLRRSIRKEVLFAAGKGGSRGRKNKKYHRSETSKILCRRK